MRMEITQQIAQSLGMKMRNAELYLKGATVIYGLQPLAARLPELVSKLVFRPEPAVEESYELLRDWTYNLATPPRTLLSYCCNIIISAPIARV